MADAGCRGHVPPHPRAPAGAGPAVSRRRAGPAGRHEDGDRHPGPPQHGAGEKTT